VKDNHELNREALEKAAAAAWNEESRRALGRDRLVPWSEVAEHDQERWRGLARAAISALPRASGVPEAEAVAWQALRQANTARQQEWDTGAEKVSASFRGLELAGEVGEACNVIKKLERERIGIKGSRDTVEHLAEELADAVICSDLIAASYGVELWTAIVAKFNATSEKHGFSTRLAAPHGEAVTCVACEGRPQAPNNPCVICGSAAPPPVAAPSGEAAMPTQRQMNEAFYVDVCRAEDRLKEFITASRALLDSLPPHWHGENESELRILCDETDAVISPHMHPPKFVEIASKHYGAKSVIPPSPIASEPKATS